MLRELNESTPPIMLSMIIFPDRFALVYREKVEDSIQGSALYIELQLICAKIISDLNYGALEEVFVRSQSGCVVLLPIADKGLLACMSTPDVHASKMRIFTWKAVNRLAKIL